MEIITKAVSFLLAIAMAVTGFFMSFARNIIPGREETMKETTALDGEDKNLSAEEIVAIYNDTIKAMNKFGSVSCNSFVTIEKVETSGSADMDSFIDKYNEALKGYVGQKIKPSAPLTADDIISARAKESGRFIEIEIRAKDSKINMEDSDKDSVAGRIGIAGMDNMKKIIKYLGISFSDNPDDSYVKYSNVRVYCLIDTEKNKIVNGEWSYDEELGLKNARYFSLESTQFDMLAVEHVISQI